jgi:hypothetical protein
MGLTAEQLHGPCPADAGFYGVQGLNPRGSQSVKSLQQRASFRVKTFASNDRFGHGETSE